MSVRKMFFDWDRVPLDCAVEVLTKAWANDVLDLSDWIVVVPTRHAGRRLRERLAVTAASRQSAVIPGRIIAPEALFRPKESSRPFTDSLSATLLWREVVANLKPDECPTLFPKKPFHEFSEQTALASQLYDLRERLCEEGYTIRSFSNHYKNNPESDRWNDLCRLEDKFLLLAEKHGFSDLCMAKIHAASSPDTSLLDVKHLCVLFVPDPVPLAKQVLLNIAKQRSVDICIHAPKNLDSYFDEAGCPRQDYWISSEIQTSMDHIFLSQQPYRMLKRTADHLAYLPPKERMLCTIGVPDASLSTPMQELLTDRDVDHYNPAGTPAAEGVFFHLLNALFEFLTNDDYAATATLLRHPVFLDYMKQVDVNFSSGKFLISLDAFQNKHIPNDYRSFLFFAEQDNWYPKVIEQLNDIHQRLADDPVGSLFDILRMLFADKSFKKSDKSDALVTRSVEILRQKISVLQSSPMIDRLTAQDKMLFLMQEFCRMRITTDRSPEAVDLMGWLELHWDDAPQLLLCGMNDGIVPETVTGHIFLPDQACIETGLRNNRTRLARDAYLLQAITACRAPGQVIHLLSKQSFSGDPLRPSRLLLMVPNEELPNRVNLLFGDANDVSSTPPHCHDWQLDLFSPEKSKSSTDISVSALNDYLTSPILFYLKRILDMQLQDDRKEEMDAGDFGEICHKAFECFSAGSYAHSVSAGEIEDVLITQADRLFTDRFGYDLAVPLMLQREALFSRLRTAARIQAEWRRQGWRIETDYSEKKFDFPLPGGLCLTGRIDRIDRNEHDGRLCVLDYKSSDIATPPEKRHLGNTQKDTPEYAITPDGKKRWNNIQLAAYMLMVRHHLPELSDRFCCGFFNLPRTPSDTSIEIWDTITPVLIDSAEACINACAENIRRGIFQPAGRLKYDDEFKALLFGDPDKVTASLFCAEEVTDA